MPSLTKIPTIHNPCLLTGVARGLAGSLLLGASMMCLGTSVAVAQDPDTKFFGGSAKGFTGLSIYTATGYQHATVKTSNLKAQVLGTDVPLPSVKETTHSTFWLTGLDYTYVFDNKFSLGAQVDYYPKSTQVALSISPGYEFSDRVLGYMRLGWASVPYTVQRGGGIPSYKTRLDAYFAGVGAKVNLYRGIYAFAEVRYSEVERVNFTAMRDYEVLPGTQVSVPIQGTADTTAVNAFIGLGYRF